MKIDHTPGPWHVGGKGGTIVYSGDGYAVANCTVYHGVHKSGESEANACLMAAAPDLFEALQNLVELAEVAMKEANRDGAEYNIEAELSEARQAINEAKGKF